MNGRNRLLLLMGAGLSWPRAVAEVLDGGISGFAARRGFHRSYVSQKLNGLQPLATMKDDPIVLALADELGADPDWVTAQVDEYSAAKTA